MNAQRIDMVAFLIAVNFCLSIRSASSQHLTEQWVEQAAQPLIENKIADGLSIGYIEGDHFGIVHLGTADRSKEKANYSDDLRDRIDQQGVHQSLARRCGDAR